MGSGLLKNGKYKVITPYEGSWASKQSKDNLALPTKSVVTPQSESHNVITETTHEREQK